MKFDIKKKAISVTAMLAFLLVTLFFYGCGSARKASSGIPSTGGVSLYKVTAAEETTVALERTKQQTDLPLPPEYDLVDGDTLENKGEKPASIKDIKGGHKFVLSPKAKVKLGVQKLTLYRGKSLFEFRKVNGEFKIFMPNAVLGIRGTRFFVDVQDDGKTIVKMFEGKLEIEKNGQVTPLQNQEMAEIDSTPIAGEGQTEPKESSAGSGVKVIPADKQTPEFLKGFENNDGSAIQTF